LDSDSFCLAFPAVTLNMIINPDVSADARNRSSTSPTGIELGAQQIYKTIHIDKVGYSNKRVI